MLFMLTFGRPRVGPWQWNNVSQHYQAACSMLVEFQWWARYGKAYLLQIPLTLGLGCLGHMYSCKVLLYDYKMLMTAPSDMLMPCKPRNFDTAESHESGKALSGRPKKCALNTACSKGLSGFRENNGKISAKNMRRATSGTA